MARQNEGVWYRRGEDTWYITLPDGKKKSLRVKGEGNEKEAVKAWHRLMANPKPLEAPQKRSEPIPEAKAKATVKEVLDAFLSDAKARVKPTTFKNYNAYLTPFMEVHGKVKAEALTIARTLAYANRDGWGQAHRYNLLGAIKTAYKWAEEVGIIGKNPIKAMKRPSMPSRGAKVSITPEDNQRLLNASTPCFRLFLTMLHETGCRPSELARLTVQDVDFASGVAVLTEHKTAHKTGKPRIIIFNPKAMDILRTQAEANPTGTLFRTERGSDWNTSLLQNTMRATNKRAGTKCIAYAYRHGYATDALSKGVPDATVAALLGHSGTAMLHKHYSHLTSRIAVLRDAANKIR